MNTYLVTGGFTVYEYRSRAYDANSKDEAILLARLEFKNNRCRYIDWELEEASVMNNFEIIEVDEL